MNFRFQRAIALATTTILFSPPTNGFMSSIPGISMVSSEKVLDLFPGNEGFVPMVKDALRICKEEKARIEAEPASERKDCASLITDGADTKLKTECYAGQLLLACQALTTSVAALDAEIRTSAAVAVAATGCGIACATYTTTAIINTTASDYIKYACTLPATAVTLAEGAESMSLLMKGQDFKAWLNYHGFAAGFYGAGRAGSTAAGVAAGAAGAGNMAAGWAGRKAADTAWSMAGEKASEEALKRADQSGQAVAACATSAMLVAMFTAKSTAIIALAGPNEVGSAEAKTGGAPVGIIPSIAKSVRALQGESLAFRAQGTGANYNPFSGSGTSGGIRSGNGGTGYGGTHGNGQESGSGSYDDTWAETVRAASEGPLGGALSSFPLGQMTAKDVRELTGASPSDFAQMAARGDNLAAAMASNSSLPAGMRSALKDLASGGVEAKNLPMPSAVYATSGKSGGKAGGSKDLDLGALMGQFGSMFGNKKGESARAPGSVVAFRGAPEDQDIYHSKHQGSIFQIVSGRIDRSRTRVDSLPWTTPINRAMHGEHSR